MTKYRSFIRGYAPVALSIAILATALSVNAGTTNVTLAWDANTETNLAGYLIHYGTASGSYSATKLVSGNATSATISNLTSGQVYYFAAKATNAAGLESAFSTEISYTAPVPPNTAPVAIAQNVAATEDVAKAITLTGTDVDGNPLTFSIVASPTYGLLSGTIPNITYTPAANFNGNDSFTFRANDGTANSAVATVSITVAPANDTPLAVAQNVSTSEDTAKAITLSGSDPDGNTLNYAIVASPLHGTLTGSAPNLTYIPATNYNGSDSFTFKVNDGTVDSATATVSLSVSAANDEPIAVAQSVSTAEDVAKAITLAASDVEGTTLTYAIVAAPANGTLSGTPPNVTYRPGTNYSGSDSFTFKANDGTVNSAAATVSITVTPVNDAPVAVAQTVATGEDTAKAITLAANDVEGDALSFAVVVAPAHGTLSGTAPNLTYLPSTNYSGADSFTFKANDGAADSTTVSVSINVTAGNDAPVAIAQNVTTAEDTAKAITLAATDADGNTLTYSITTQPTHGTLSGTAPNLTYTPTANYNGSDSLTFKANDGTLDSASATVSINVTTANDLPVAVAQSVSTAEETAKAITLAATDLDGDSLTYAVVAAPTHGNLSGATPNLTYTPAANYNGADSFTFKANDGTGDSAIVTVSINVTAVNDAPAAVAQNITTAEDTAKLVTLSGTDTDGNTLTYAVTAQPAHGTLSGTAPNLTYTPTANFNGSDSFAFKVNDGTVDSLIATVSINVTAVNDTPIASAQSVATDRNVAKAIALSGTDADNDALTYTVATQPTKGVLSGSAPDLTYTPNNNVTGTDSFTFKVNDGTTNSTAATVSINIAAGPNTAPVALAQSASATEDTAKNITLGGTDADGDTLSYSVVASPAHGTLSGTVPNLTYTPALNYNGSDSFTFRANDGTTNSATATVAITVDAANDTPVATAQGATTAEDTGKVITLAGTDVDSDALTYAIVTSPTHGTLSGTAPNLTYLPTTNYSGADSFTFKANDGTVDSATATVSINVTAANDAPVASAQSVTTAEDTAKAITLSASDTDGNTLTYSVVAQPAHGTLSGTGANLTYKPATNYNGADTFTFKANDGTVDSSTTTVSITVNAINDTPVATAQTVGAVEDTAKAITLAGTDADSDSLSYSIVASPAHGTLSGAAPNVTYLPATNYNGADSFTFKVNDGTVDSATTTVSINVTSGNDAPVAVAQSVTTNEDTAKAITLAATDADGNTLTYTVTGAPAHGALTGTAPNLTYTPTANYNGSDSFTFKANDGIVDSTSATISITITAVNDAPVANSQSLATDKNVTKAVTLTATDADGDTLTYAIITQPTKGALSGTAPNLTYTPNLNITGTDSFTFRASDGVSNSAVATIAINIAAGPNTAPVAVAQNVTATEDIAKAITLAANDVDGDTLSYTVTTAPAHGTLSGTAPNLTYLPATNYNGSDTFWFRANDGLSNSALAVVSITVNAGNDQPTATSQSLTTAEDAAKAITLAGTDIDGDTLSFIITVPPSHGTLSGSGANLTYLPATNYNGNDSFSFKVNDGTADSPTATVSLTVTPANDAPVATTQNVAATEDATKAINLGGSDVDGNSITYAIVTQPAHGTLSGTAPNMTYKPATNYNGPDSFTFKVNDGSLDSPAAAVALTVAPANDTPIALEQSVATDKNIAKAITLTGTDVDGDALTYTVVTQPTKGTLGGTAPNLTYTPNNNVTGADVFTFKASDATVNSAAAAVYININAGPNTAPVAAAQDISTTEDTAKAITLSATDEDGNAITYNIVTLPNHGTLSGTAPNLTFTPDTDYSGSDSLWFTASDGATSSVPAVVSIVITPVNDVPTLNTPGNVSLAAGAGAQTVPLSGISAGSNESQPLSVTADSSNPSLIPSPTVNYTSPDATGALNFTPAAGASGTAIISITVDDGQSQNRSVTRSFTVTVAASNSAPSIALTSPTNAAGYASPATIHLGAAASAPGHTITKVQFFAGTNLVNEDSSAPYEFDWTGVNAGSYSLVARLVYNGSSTLDSAPVTVLVENLPGPWTTGDIGPVAVKGAVLVTNGVYTVEGAGALTTTSDSCRYVYQPLSADGEIKIRIDSAGDSNASTDVCRNVRAGVMIRESLIPGSRYAFAGISADGLYRWQARSATGGKTTAVSARGGTAGSWILLLRIGKTVTSYGSSDGVRWTKLATSTVSMAPNVYVGIAVASGSPTSLTTSQLTSPTVVP